VALCALGVPRLWGVSADACACVALFFSTSLAFGACIDEDALHAMFFPRNAHSPRFRPWLCGINWILGQVLMLALLRICDSDQVTQGVSTELTVTFIGCTYFDLLFGMACAEHRRVRGQEPNMGFFIIALGPTVVYAVFLAYLFMWFDDSLLPKIVATDTALVFALPVIQTNVLSPQLLSIMPSFMVRGGTTAPALDSRRWASTAKAVYVALCVAIWWHAPPLRIAALLEQTPSRMLAEWRAFADPALPGAPSRATVCRLLAVAGALSLAVALPAVGLRLYRGFWQTAALLDSLAHCNRQRRSCGGCGASEGEAERAWTAHVDGDVATVLWEWAWGPCLHFAEQYRGETFQQALLRHEYYLAGQLRASVGTRILDVGCGVGGIARNVARFADARVTGVTTSQFQVDRGNAMLRQEGLSDQVELVRADLTSLPFPDGSFDAVYSMESLCRSPDRAGVCRELRRVLKPGGILACYEWCLTEAYNPASESHRSIRQAIERGNSLSGLPSAPSCGEALAREGLEVLSARDCALGSRVVGDAPWYQPLRPSWNIFRWPNFQFNPVSKWATPVMLGLGEDAGFLPPGAAGICASLLSGAAGLVAGGSAGIFTPMWLVVARKAR